MIPAGKIQAQIFLRLSAREYVHGLCIVVPELAFDSSKILFSLADLIFIFEQGSKS